MLNKQRQGGFTLVEILLVIVIASAIVSLLVNYTTQRMDQLRRDRTATQTQNVLSGALAYYLNFGQFPAAPSWTGFAGTYFYEPKVQPAPVNAPVNAYGSAFSYKVINQQFFVWADTKQGTAVSTLASVNASIIAGMLPMGFTTNTAGATQLQAGTVPAICTSNCTIAVGVVTIPGQNLNNARSVNFAGIYHSGACVPVPSCPLNMTAQIFVSAASVSGANTAPSGSTLSVNPITSFTASAVGPATGNVGRCPDDTQPATYPCYSNGQTGSVAAGNYWRVCLTVVTSQGHVVQNTSNSTWGLGKGSIIAITRCVPTGENAGSGFSVWGY